MPKAKQLVMPPKAGEPAPAVRQGTPNIGTLMFTPYLRIIPMHLTIITGSFLGNRLLLFGALKIVADVAMHLVEHAQLRSRAEPAKSE